MKKKVFISYCWNQYDPFVINLAINLSVTYDVIFDKWTLKPGHNLVHFMEESIKKADKVLILCEKEYVNKADNKSSGVGIETSIISSSVYNDSKQEKFIPLFLEGIQIKPVYMQSILGIEIIPGNELDSDKLTEITRAIEGKSFLDKPINDEIILKSNIITPVSSNKKVQENSSKVNNFMSLLEFLDDDLISKYIVKKQLTDFGLTILKFDNDIQLKFIDSIKRNYQEATGYLGWDNYDIFGRIGYDVAMNTDNDQIKSIASSILEQCASIRYNLKDLLDEYKMSKF